MQHKHTIMRQLTKVLFVFISICQLTYSQDKVTKWESITMINNVQFNNSKFDNKNAACGFLIKYKNDTLAVTAKHVLIVIRPDSMHTTFNLEHGLKQWTMQPKDKKEQIVIMDRLLNGNYDDSLNSKYYVKQGDDYHDWLIFSIKENKSKVKPLEIRKTELINGEKLFFIGWSYVEYEGEQRSHECEYISSNKKGTYFDMKLIGPMFYIFGYSGSPVIDKDGLLVGIMSEFRQDSVSKEYIVVSAKVDYLTHFLDSLYSKNK